MIAIPPSARRLLENRAGTRGRWIMFRLGGHSVEQIGAMVKIEAAGRSQWRAVQRAYSYQASHDPRVHFGLGEAGAVDEVLVVWPGSRRESFGAFPAGTVHELRQGKGEPASHP